MDVNRKGRHKERNRKKEEPEKAAELQQQDVEEDAEVDEEENIYISDQEEEKRGFLYCLFLAFSVNSNDYTVSQKCTPFYFSNNSAKN